MKKVIYCLIVLVFILVIVYAVFKNTKNVEVETNIIDYVPQEEISNAQNRTTLLTLYFVDPTTGTLMPEVRQLDVKEIIDNPYEKIMNLLLEGSQNESIGKTIPDGTKVNSVVLENENLIIDLSKEFIQKYDISSEEQKKIIYSIVDTFIQLKEISSVTFLIDGEKVDNMSDPFVKLQEL